MRDDLLDFVRCPIHSHPLAQAGGGNGNTKPLLTLVVPCYRPDLEVFIELLLSLQQQTDPCFNLVLVDDASTDPTWLRCLPLIHRATGIAFLRMSSNAGISAAVARGVASARTPYVAILDQDDFLHPRAVERINSHLRAHPDCRMLYSDHIAFDWETGIGRYVPKFPWNPTALLEFNYLIHLTVYATELFRRSGGFDSRYDGIQDWEFHLRLAPLLKAAEVAYLPFPLYFWRISPHTVASSDKPREVLRQKAREFLERIHREQGLGCRVTQALCSASHYFFAVDRSGCCSARSQGARPYRALVPADPSPALAEELEVTLLSLFNASPAPELVVVWTGAEGLPSDCLERPALQPFLERVSVCSPMELSTAMLSDRVLLALTAGCRLEPDADLAPLLAWQEATGQDLLTLPVLGEDEGTCLQAGMAYVSPLGLWMPQGQGRSLTTYLQDFASFGHTREVDAISPWIALLRPGVAKAAVAAFATRQTSSVPTLPPSLSWFAAVAFGRRPALCPVGPWVIAGARLAAASRRCLLAVDRGWVSATGALEKPGFPLAAQVRSLQEDALAHAGRSHPLHTAEFLARSGDLLSAAGDRMPEATRVPLTSLLRERPRRSVVLLIPTELNPRSNGHACLLALACSLQTAGFEVALLPFHPYLFFRNYYHILPRKYQKLRFIVHSREAPGSVLIVPESTPRKIMARLRPHHDIVLWWLLAPSGLLTSFRPDIRPNDLLLAFSSFVLPGQSNYLLVHPRSHALIRATYQQHQPHRLGPRTVAFYTGKGRLKALPRELHRELLRMQIKLITRSHPATKEALIDLLRNCHGLISFDPLTNLSLEAANLGLPVYLPANPFPDSCYRDFPVDLTGHVTDDSAVFLQRLETGGPVRKVSPFALPERNPMAVQLLDLLLSDSVATLSYRVSYHVSDALLQELETYRLELKRSRSIQVAFNGQALSSGLTSVYLRTLQLPYWMHEVFCGVLNGVDLLADLLARLGLFRVLLPFIQQFGSGLLTLSRRSRKRLPMPPL